MIDLVDWMVSFLLRSDGPGFKNCLHPVFVNQVTSLVF